MKDQVKQFISGQVTPQINVPQLRMQFSLIEGKRVDMFLKKSGPKKTELKGVLHKDGTIYPSGHEANLITSNLVFQ